MFGPTCISAVLEHLREEDISLLLSNRGLSAVGTKAELTETLQEAFRAELCEWEWERCSTPGYHAEIMGAGPTMVTHGNCIYVYGGMDEERTETNNMWRWDLSSDEGFEAITYRSVAPPKLMSGHYAAVHQDLLWVFPGPRNHNMYRVHCFDLLRYRWIEYHVTGEPPSDSSARRCLECFVDNKRLLVFGGTSMCKIWIFDFVNRHWITKACTGGLSSWRFGHAHKRGAFLLAYGTSYTGGTEDGLLEVWELDLTTLVWRAVECKGSIPAYRIHSSAACVADQWLVHGGRRTGKFNVTSETYVLDLTTWRWSVLMAEGAVEPIAREWQQALGLSDCMVLVGGRTNIPEYEPIPITNDTMCVTVEILWSRPPPPSLPPIGKSMALNQISRLYNNYTHSDITVIAGHAYIPAHQQVLATHSKVFERMWDHNLLENETKEVKIIDFSESTVRLLLQYMYGCLPVMPTRHAEVIELFKACDKYDMPGLMRECITSFRKLTRAENVAALLEVAHERESSELRAVCIDVACQCLPNVVVSPSFKTLVQRNADLCLHFIKEVSLQLAVPCLPEITEKCEQPSGDAASDFGSDHEGERPSPSRLDPLTPPRQNQPARMRDEPESDSDASSTHDLVDLESLEDIARENHGNAADQLQHQPHMRRHQGP